RLPSGDSAHGVSVATGGARMTASTNRRLRAFAVAQIALSFVLLAGAGMLVKTILALQAARPAFETCSVLAVNVPVISFGRTPEQIVNFYREARRRAAAVPGVTNAALGSVVPWRDSSGGSGLRFTVEGVTRENGDDDPRARFRTVSPGFFATLGIPLLAGRDFTDADTSGAERVVIVSASIAHRLFPGQDPINRHLMWTDGITKFVGISNEPRRIVGIVADADDESIEPAPKTMVYHPFEQEGGGRLFVRPAGEPHPGSQGIVNADRERAPNQPVERAATLDDIRADVLTPDRLNAIVFGGFAGVALAIAIVGVAGVL